MREFRQRLWDSARVAQPDILAAHYSRPINGTVSIRDLATAVHDLMRGVVPPVPPPLPLPPAHAGGPAFNGAPPSVGQFFTRLTADVRASLLVAYKFQYNGLTLESDLRANLNSAEADRAIAALYNGVQPPVPPSVWDQIVDWAHNAFNSFGNAWNDIVSAVSEFAGEAWSATTTFVTNTAVMMVTDPVGFVQTVGEGIINTTAVVGNQFTFGLIPGLNGYADNLVQNNSFYRFVNVSAVVGREIVVGMATGGAANLAINGAARAGRVAGNFLVRLGGQAAERAVARVAPAVACRLGTVQRLVQPAQAYYNIGAMAHNFSDAQAAIAAGDYETAAALIARSGSMIPGTLNAVRETGRFARAAATLSPQRMRTYLDACFAAGTPILWEGGEKPIEQLQPGERVWARHENDPDGLVELKTIEECFDRTGRTWHLHVRGEVIRTTDEHPFWVVDKGWVKAAELKVGDLLIGRDGTQTAVEDVIDTGEYETVYNFRVAEFHTYFVGSGDWGFDVWAHNRCLKAIEQLDQSDDGARSSLRGSMINDLGRAAGRNAQAHHIIPWELRKLPIIQRAAAGGFAMNRGNNGIFLSRAIHNGSHSDYTADVARRLSRINTSGMTDEQVAEAVQQVADEVRRNLRRRSTVLS